EGPELLLEPIERPSGADAERLEGDARVALAVERLVDDAERPRAQPPPHDEAVGAGERLRIGGAHPCAPTPAEGPRRPDGRTIHGSRRRHGTAERESMSRGGTAAPDGLPAEARSPSAVRATALVAGILVAQQVAG